MSPSQRLTRTSLRDCKQSFGNVTQPVALEGVASGAPLSIVFSHSAMCGGHSLLRLWGLFQGLVSLAGLSSEQSGKPQV